MDETEARLRRCFSAVFPSLSSAAIVTADATNTEEWDSVASVTLFATIEEEFGIQIDLDEATGLLSFGELLNYVRTRTPKVQ
jgi:acyl carrier protein